MPVTSSSDGPFSLGNPFERVVPRLALRIAGPVIERAMGLAELNALYATAWLPLRGTASFSAGALRILQIELDVTFVAGAAWPASGGFVIVANHPHGALDGLALTASLEPVRPDVRLLGNQLLGRIPELRGLCFFVDPFERRGATRANATALRDAMRWVERGGALVVFPAGEVSHEASEDGRPVDSCWHTTVARIAERTGAPVVPVFIDGGNGPAFRLAGRIHPLLRTALLPRELLGQRGRRVRIVVGRPVPWARLESLPESSSRTAYLRLRTYALSAPAARPPGGDGERAPIIAAVQAEHLAADVAALPPDRLLLTAGDAQVYCARARELPHVLPELGRLRETTFRAVGEGTGRSCDLDVFDYSYWHLFVWSSSRREIAGAYRVGPTDEVCAARGLRGLYTRTLFRFGRRFLDEMGPALELGRSFVRQEYQRDYGTLMLLWRGIGRFVAREPRYRMLFGPVSVSAEYCQVSRELMVGVLSSARYQSPLASLVRPRRPPRLTATAGLPDHAHGQQLGVDEIGAVLSELEADGKGMPVLLRQYLRLEAKLLAFSVDHHFGHVVDGLMIVDLADVGLPVLQRYMGREGAMAFLAAHKRPCGRGPRAEPAIAHV